MSKEKKAIMAAIFERAHELETLAFEQIGLALPKDADRDEITNAALRQAIKEWKEGKKVFKITL